MNELSVEAFWFIMSIGLAGFALFGLFEALLDYIQRRRGNDEEGL